MGLLGVGGYDVYAQERGGSPLLDRLAFSDLTFSRRLDDASSAQATVAAFSSPNLGAIRAWKHELSVLRDGEEVWVGPVMTPQWESTSVTIPANDVFFWLERRVLARDRDFPNQDAGIIFAVLAGDALEPENSMNASVAISETGIKATRSVKADERRRAADFLRELARTAVDFTVVGREIRCGGQEIPHLAAFSLNDETLRSPRLTEHGEDTSTDVIVIGSNTNNKSLIGESGGSTDDLGLIQQTYNESTIEDQNSVSAAAATRWSFLHESPLSISGVLDAQAPVDFAEVVPGARVHVHLESLDRAIDGDFRLTQVDVTVRPSDQGLQEEVAVTLSPLGTVVDG